MIRLHLTFILQSAWTPRYPRNPDIPDVLDIKSPPHAFPSAYPPSCNPFPSREGKCVFSSPVWMRHPAKSIKRSPEIDFDEFVAEFARMNVREGPRKRLVKKQNDHRNPSKPRRTQTPPPKPDRSAATLFITTRPLPAPLPALIRSTVSSPRLPLPPVLSSAGSNASHSPVTPPTLAIPQTVVPLALPEKTRKRKRTPLPRRTPATACRVHQGISPVKSDTSPPSSPPSLSPPRMSSFSSDHFSRTSSSGSSSASSAVVTPESSPVSLPTYLTPFPPIPGLFTRPDMNNVSGTSSTRSFSPGESFQFDFSSIGLDLGAGKDASATFGTLPIATPIFGQ